MKTSESATIIADICILNQYDCDGKDITIAKWKDFVENKQEEKQPQISVNDGYGERFNLIEAQLQSISTKLAQITNIQQQTSNHQEMSKFRVKVKTQNKKRLRNAGKYS